jgi:hypothetical protein
MAIYDKRYTRAVFEGKKIGAYMGVVADNIGGSPFVGIGEDFPICLITEEGEKTLALPETEEGEKTFNRMIAALADQYKADNPSVLAEWAEKWHKPII